MLGTGTPADPYIIENANDLQDMNLDAWHLQAWYELPYNIDASATIGWNAGLGFVPIGTFAARFTGHFDGKGYTISGLFINRPATSYVGLFGFAFGATINNVDLIDSNITGLNFTGALIGALHPNIIGGVVNNCYSRGVIPVTGDLGGGGAAVGGLIGAAGELEACSISRCYSTHPVIAQDEGGGLVGRPGGDTLISECFATGDIGVVWEGGGLIGSGGPGGFRLRDCYARGNANATNSRAGGLIGITSGLGPIDNCYSTGLITCPAQAGGLIGVNAFALVNNCFWDTESSGMAISAGGTGLTTAEMKIRATFSAAGWNLASIWHVVMVCNNGYPCLRGVTPSCTMGAAVVITLPATGVT